MKTHRRTPVTAAAHKVPGNAMAQHRSLLPLSVILAGTVMCQWMLTEPKYSSVKAEWFFRILFLAPSAFNAVAVFMVGKSATWTSNLRVWLGVLPMIFVVSLFLLARLDSDAQGAIFIFMLPFIHLFLTLLFFFFTLPVRNANGRH